MRILVLMTAVTLGAGCHYDPHAYLYTTEKPGEADVVGTYTLVSETVSKSHPGGLRGRTCSVRLNMDGTFEASNIPDFFSTLRTGSGTWRLDAVGVVDNYWNRHTVWGIYFDSPGDQLARANLTGRGSPYGMIVSLGDPGNGEALILERSR